MALLQDQEARLKKTEERKKHGTRVAQVATGFLFGTIVACGVLVLFVLYAVSPNSGLIKRPSTSYNDRLTNKLIGTIHQGAESVLPTEEAIEALRKKLAKGDFALLTTPDVKSTKTNTTITYDLRLVRSEGFNEPIRVSAANLPITVTATTTPEVVDQGSETASVRLVIPGDAKEGSYSFNILAKADTKEKAANAQLSVTNLAIENAELVEVRQMDAGSKWQATIKWDTDVPANTWIEYAPDVYFNENGQTYAYTSANQENTETHATTLYYLEQGVVYHYRIRSVDTLNNIVVGPDRVLVTQTE